MSLCTPRSHSRAKNSVAERDKEFSGLLREVAPKLPAGVKAYLPQPEEPIEAPFNPDEEDFKHLPSTSGHKAPNRGAAPSRGAGGGAVAAGSMARYNRLG